MDTRFQIGHKLAKGGRREGAGRKPDKFKKKLQKIVTSAKALKFLVDAINGEHVEPRVTQTGVIYVPASPHVRHAIWESLHDRGFGKPVDVLQMQDKDGKTSALPAVVFLPSQQVREGVRVGGDANGDKNSGG